MIIGKNNILNRIFVIGVMAFISVLLLNSCSGGGGDGQLSMNSSDIGTGDIFPPSGQTVTGKIVIDNNSAFRQINMLDNPIDICLTVDEDPTEIPLDSQGSFEMVNIPDGDHSLYFNGPNGELSVVPFRMLAGRGIGMGTIRITVLLKKSQASMGITSVSLTRMAMASTTNLWT